MRVVEKEERGARVIGQEPGAQAVAFFLHDTDTAMPWKRFAFFNATVTRSLRSRCAWLVRDSIDD